MNHEIKSATVFCSAASTYEPHVKLMQELGRFLVKNHWTLVFGGGSLGLMGTVLRSVKDAGGKVRGIITGKLLNVELPNPEIYKDGELEIVETMNVRKHKLFEYGDIVIIGPGGWGTVDEFSEMAVGIQIGDVKRKPMIFLNADGFWEPLKKQIATMVDAQTLDETKLDFIGFADTIDAILPAIEKVQAQIKASDAIVPEV